MRQRTVAAPRPPLGKTAVLNIAFALTGFATPLLGCLLPSLSLVWQMNDSHAGRLLAAQFAGSAIGALLPGQNFQRSANKGYLVLFVACAALALLALAATPAFALRLLLFLCFGLGLGWAMTSTSLLVGTLFRAARGSALSILNAVWTIGAALSPIAAVSWARQHSPVSIFLPLGVAVLVCTAGIRLTAGPARSDPSAVSQPVVRNSNRLLIVFAMMAFLYVGIEASISGWIITLVHRETYRWSGVWAPIAASCFWIAILTGRLMAPAVLFRIAEQKVLNFALLLAGLGLAALLVSHIPVVILLTAFICGLALAPVFPIIISRCLSLSGESVRTRYVFAISGFGGATLPWLTGIASSSFHSIRIALCIPLIAIATMTAIAFAFEKIAHVERSQI